MDASFEGSVRKHSKAERCMGVMYTFVCFGDPIPSKSGKHHPHIEDIPQLGSYGQDYFFGVGVRNIRRILRTIAGSVYKCVHIC